MRTVVISDRVVGKGVSGDPMKNTAHISLALTATAFTLVGAFFVKPPPAAARAGGEDLELTSSSSFDQNRFAATENLLCGLTFADVADIIDHYGFTPDMPALADALSTPFDCGAYGQLCEHVSEVDANTAVCTVWDDLRTLKPVAQIAIDIRDRFDEVFQECQPSNAVCQGLCGPDNTVLLCDGYRFNGGPCMPIVACEEPPPLVNEFELFPFLHQ
jgi:hypothetical protein